MKKILIVEDIALNLDLLEQLLEDEYDLVTADNGADGVETAIREQPDLVLMDISLPVMDGYEATRRIKAHRSTAKVPIIALTAHAMSSDEEMARAAGCDDFLTKPLDEELLFEKLDHFLGEDG